VECPQHAKQVESDINDVKKALQMGRRVVLSLAPSFISVFPDYSLGYLNTSLKQVGFTAVEETAVGAGVVSQRYKLLLTSSNKPVISACCPVVVDLIRKYYPQLVDNLADVVSPMIAHGRILKHKYGSDAFITFAGPCISKIAEAREYEGAIDAVISFPDLLTLLNGSTEQEYVVLDQLPGTPAMGARYFPITGGIVKSFMNTNDIDYDIVAVDGISECIEVFDGLIKGEITPQFIEALACRGGCIGGPVSGNSQCMAARRAKVISFAHSGSTQIPSFPNIQFERKHIASPVINSLPTNEQIEEILRKTGKFKAADEKNCGACGYNTCREKAIAVYQGIAETDMCVPYMRSKAESFANIIVDYSLNGIIVVDQNLIVQEFNPTAQRMFHTRFDMIKGKSLAQSIDCSDFMYVLTTGNKISGKRVEYPQYGLITEQKIIPVREHGVVIAIVSDVTSDEKRAKELQRMKLETAEKATEIITKQMQVAQEIAGLLGETTAETKSALLELVWLLKDKEEK
jgi:uncharacterized Fe-S cluster-containing protein